MIVTFTLATILALKQPTPSIKKGSEVGYAMRQIKPIETLPQPSLPIVEQISVKPVETVTDAVTQGVGSSSNLYDPGQCTWYVKNRRSDIPNSWGNATTWYERAEAQGWQVGLLPKPGAIGWEYGHVVYVEAVSATGITISEMNYDFVPYHLRTRSALATDFKYIY